MNKQEDGTQILVTLDGKLPEHIDGAAAQMRRLLPLGSIIGEEHDVRSLLRRNSEAIGPGMLSPAHSGEEARLASPRAKAPAAAATP